MPAPTLQQVNDFGEDLEFIDALSNDLGTVTNRNGDTVKTVRQLQLDAATAESKQILYVESSVSTTATTPEPATGIDSVFSVKSGQKYKFDALIKIQVGLNSGLFFSMFPSAASVNFIWEFIDIAGNIVARDSASSLNIDISSAVASSKSGTLSIRGVFDSSQDETLGVNWGVGSSGTNATFIFAGSLFELTELRAEEGSIQETVLMARSIQSVTSSTIPSNNTDSELTISSLASGAYIFEALIIWQQSGGSSQGIKWGFGASGGGTDINFQSSFPDSASIFAVNMDGSASSEPGYDLGSTTSVGIISIKGYLNTPNTTDFSFRFAQNNSNANATVRLPGSWMKVRRAGDVIT